MYSSLIIDAIPTAKVEHIGASSVAGAWSKGDLDIYVEVDPAVFEETIGCLIKLGFREKEDTLRTSELCMLESITDAEVAIQLVCAGSKFKFFLDFAHVVKLRLYV